MLIQTQRQQTYNHHKRYSSEALPKEDSKDCFSDHPFVRDIWKTYFLHKTGLSIDDKMFHFTKFVSIIKEKSTDQIESENKKLKQEFSKLKQQKNSCEEKIIQLSNKLYDMQRGLALNMSGEFPPQEEANTTLDQFSAISIDRYDERQRNKNTLFSKKPSFNFDFDEADARSEENNEIEELKQFNLNFPKKMRHPLKQSLHVNPKQFESQDYKQFIVDINKMKLQTERMMKIQNDRLQQKEVKRKTFAAFTQRPNMNDIHPVEKENRRFKRIRA